MKARIKKIGFIDEIIILITWSASLFGYFFQFPFNSVSRLIVPALAVYLLVLLFNSRKKTINQRWLAEYVVYATYLTFMIFLSFFREVEVGRIMRFFLILAMIPLFAVVRKNEFELEYKVFILFSVAKSILLIYFAIILIRTGNHTQLRNWAFANHYGDIYINPYTHLPKVQVQGNGILPMALILNISYGKKGWINNIVNIVLTLGILVAGNSAFILGVGAFCFYWLYSNIFKRGKSTIIRILSIAMVVVGAVIFIAYSIYTLDLKAGYSNSIRSEQVKALLNDFSIIGNGLGHEIFYVGTWRIYSGDTYFELQTLYFLNQIGVIGMILFYRLVLKPINKIGKRELMLFLVYLIYSFWNPYCFDTTEMIVVTLIVNYPLYVYSKQADNRIQHCSFSVLGIDSQKNASY